VSERGREERKEKKEKAMRLIPSRGNIRQRTA
jgi:hypothetical protein